MDYLLFPFDFANRIYDVNSNPFKDKKISKGKKYAKECHCIVGTLLRDSEESFKYGVKNIEKISKIFKTVDVFILENDSKDNTRKLWKEYSRKCPENVKFFIETPNIDNKIIKYRTVNHESTEIRIKKMILLRNNLLKIIKKKSRKFDYNTYVFITDLDIKGEIVKNGIYDTFYHFKKRKNIDAIGCNGLTWNCFYFDDYAYKNNYKKIHSALDVPVNRGLFRVKSTFSGGIFYKYDVLMDLKYKFRKQDNKIICEHITLNENINKIYINTNMIYYISEH